MSNNDNFIETLNKLTDSYDKEILNLKTKVEMLERKNESLEVVLYGYKNRKGVVDDLEKCKSQVLLLENFKLKALVLVTFVSTIIGIIGFIISNWGKFK